jgi:hypothetical protein
MLLLKINKNNNKYILKGLGGLGSSGRASAWQVSDPEFKPQYYQACIKENMRGVTG